MNFWHCICLIVFQEISVSRSGGTAMNWDQIEGNWKQFKGKVKEKWGQLTDDDLDQAAGKRDQIIGRLQARYGWQRDRAERELDELTHTW
jgi:uncharacterized protein YjbJ (UPF0337 family)